MLHKIDEAPLSQKFSHMAVNYEKKSTHPGEECSTCSHFIKSSPNRCEGVCGPIDNGGWCLRWDDKSPAVE